MHRLCSLAKHSWGQMCLKAEWNLAAEAGPCCGSSSMDSTCAAAVTHLHLTRTFFPSLSFKITSIMLDPGWAARQPAAHKTI